MTASQTAAQSPAAAEEAWLTQLASEPDWTLQTPVSAGSVETVEAAAPEVAADPAASAEGSAEAATREPAAATREPAAATREPADARARELEDALSWGEELVGGLDAAGQEVRAEIDEAMWPYLDYPVDEFGFPIVPEGFEALFSGRHGAPSPDSQSAAHAGGGTGPSENPEHDPERIARVLQKLAERIRAGALRLPGEVDRGDEAVVLAATLTALLSRHRE